MPSLPQKNSLHNFQGKKFPFTGVIKKRQKKVSPLATLRKLLSDVYKDRTAFCVDIYIYIYALLEPHLSQGEIFHHRRNFFFVSFLRSKRDRCKKLREY